MFEKPSFLKYLLIWLHLVFVVILFLDQRSNPGSLQWELGVLAAGPPRKFFDGIFNGKISWLWEASMLKYLVFLKLAW